MNSPITGNPMKVCYELRDVPFRNEELQIVFGFYKCEESELQFTDTRLDTINTVQLHNRYREKHNLPFPEQIKKIRTQYGLSAIKMSETLGFGVNSYRKYESGEVPSLSNGKLINLAADPRKFQSLIELSDSLSEEDKKELCEITKDLIEENEKEKFQISFAKYLLENKADSYSGYRIPSLDRFTEMVVYFTAALGPWMTKMNKLMFYADFLNYKKTGYSLSGAHYRAIVMGPVPNNYSSLYEYVANQDEIDLITHPFNNGVGYEFRSRNDRAFDPELFNEDELAVLENVATFFKDTSTPDIIEFSHKEKAWQQNESQRALIKYDYAFELSIE